ncbi:MAG: hypothetical protein LLG24_07955 [Actinomycetia bacterium]|nr:hypothetical protein [Actinomycetes bacterium]
MHQKPIVAMKPGGRCELGDLLVVVKYHLLDGTTEKKSIIYQVKLTDSKRAQCKIDQKQLRLLRDWPDFEFGRRRDGGPRTYRIRPLTLEFGSYMLEPRRARNTDVLDPWVADVPLLLGEQSLVWRRTFGFCPTAWQVSQDGPKSIAFSKLAHTTPDADALVSQLAFCLGEHHSNLPVDDLVSSLCRYVGLDPDPPDEFDGYIGKETRSSGFGVLELNVKQSRTGRSEPGPES